MHSEVMGTLRFIPGRPPVLILLAAVVFGLVVGLFAIHNTSIGWHLGSGRWMLEHRQVIRDDPFSYTAEGTPWIDHEWLFQILVALVERVSGAPGLIAFRCLLVAALTVLLLVIALRAGLAPPAALLLTVLCVAAARMRFFLRPELCTLLLVPLVLALFLRLLEEQEQPSAGAMTRRLLGLAGIMVLGVNLHGGALVAGPLLGIAWLATLLRRPGRRRVLVNGALGLATIGVAACVNPYGWRLLTVPLMITHLVGLPHIPNPEWLSPSPAEVPSLWITLLLCLAVMGFKGRDPVRWLLLLATAGLALRYVRNVGLFFVVLPLLMAPALARWQLLSAGGAFGAGGRWRRVATSGALMVAVLLAAGFFVAPFHPIGLSYAAEKYPIAACDFAEQEGLLSGRIYNDVGFGGYLIGRYYPPLQVFLDDRNEIHEPLLREIYDLLRRGDRHGRQQLLEHWQIDTALVRYHQPRRILAPDGRCIATEGYSTLWFPASQWALVYWDDVAMVLVRRSAVAPALLDREYRLIRPDDLDRLADRLARGKVDRELAMAEVQRRLSEEPACRRAEELLSLLREP